MGATSQGGSGARDLFLAILLLQPQRWRSARATHSLFCDCHPNGCSAISPYRQIFFSKHGQPKVLVHTLLSLHGNSASLLFFSTFTVAGEGGDRPHQRWLNIL